MVRRSTRRILIAFSAIATAVPAHAHGEQILAIPLGCAGSVLFFLISMFLLRKVPDGRWNLFKGYLFLLLVGLPLAAGIYDGFILFIPVIGTLLLTLVLRFRHNRAVSQGKVQ